MAPWHLDLGSIEQHQLSIELHDRELLLGFDPPLGSTSFAPSRIEMVQAGSHVDLPAWHTPVRSLGLPWAGAPLDDLWLALHTAGRRHWFELPYGLCRAPGAHHAAPQLGPPRSPPEAGSDDAVLPWQTLRFTLGRARRWQLSVIARGGRAGEIEIVARRAEPGLPPPIVLTALLGSRPLPLVALEPWGTEAAPLHAARYRFAPPALAARTYVQFTAACAGASFELQLPTSLTDPGHRSRR